jgi:hypothetical protein
MIDPVSLDRGAAPITGYPICRRFENCLKPITSVYKTNRESWRRSLRVQWRLDCDRQGPLPAEADHRLPSTPPHPTQPSDELAILHSRKTSMRPLKSAGYFRRCFREELSQPLIDTPLLAAEREIRYQTLTLGNV